MFGLKHLGFTAALLLIAVKGQDDTYDDYATGLIEPYPYATGLLTEPDVWEPKVGPGGINPISIVEKPEPIKVDNLGDLGDWFKAGSIQSEIMSSFSIKELE